MEEFDIKSLADMKISSLMKTEYKIQNGFPNGKEFGEYRIENTMPFHIRVSDKNMIIFQIVETDNETICISDYIFNKSMTLRCESNSQILEFYSTLYGSIKLHLTNDKIRICNFGHYNCITAPAVSNIVTLSGKIRTFDSHPKIQYFDQLTEQYPTLSPVKKAYLKKRTATVHPDAGCMTTQALLNCIEFIRSVHEENISRKKRTEQYRKIIDELLSPKGKTLEKLHLTYDQINALSILANHLRQYTENNYTIDDLQKLVRGKFAFTTKKLRAAFEAVFNKTPTEFIKATKMHQAKTYLDTGLPEKEVAERIGYENLSNFEKSFQKYFGTTVKEYKTEIKSNINK